MKTSVIVDIRWKRKVIRQNEHDMYVFWTITNYIHKIYP